MMHIKILDHYKSLIAGKEVDLPDFCVLTGKNGSGKSHFLEAISTNNYADVVIDNKKISNNEVRYIPFNALNPQIKSECNQNSLNQITNECWQFLQLAQKQWKMPGNSDKKTEWLWMLKDRFAHNRINSTSYCNAVINACNKAKKEFDEMTEDDFRFFIDFSDLDQKDAFKGEFAIIFKSYQLKYDQNEYNCFENAKRHTSHIVLTDSEFEEMYGPKPWEFVNSIFKDANLPYEVSNPEGTNRDSIFHFSLKNIEKNIDIQPGDLSTGEKVLMSLSLAIYNSAKDSIKNSILLIDEPDASLHPEFSKFLLNTIKNHIIGKAGIKVIITTHSPTTVAMADEESIYEMDKNEKIPIKVSKEKALSILTEDIPSLRVSIDKRRVVFVESQYDAENYEKIGELLKKYHSFDTQLSFHAATDHSGSNCSDVYSMLDTLKNVHGVYGVVDYDNHNTSTNNVKVMGDGGEKRYTIENYILDPVYIGLALIRDNLVKCPLNEITYISFEKNTPQQKQDFIDWILNELGFNGPKVKYKIVGGEVFSIDSNWVTQKGHDIEAKIKTKWACINQIISQYKNKGDNALKCALLDKTIRDYPQYLSYDFINLFNSLA